MIRGCFMLLKNALIDKTDAINPRIIAALPTAPRKSYIKRPFFTGYAGTPNRMQPEKRDEKV